MKFSVVSLNLGTCSQTCQTSKIGCSSKIVNGQSRQLFSLHVPSEMFERVLNTPLEYTKGKITIYEITSISKYIPVKQDLVIIIT